MCVEFLNTALKLPHLQNISLALYAI